MGMEDIDEDEDDARRSKPEEVTVQLATSLLQRPLYLCLLQYSDEFTELDAEHQLYAKVVDDPIASDGSDFSIE
ncbi:hypothetical protein F5B17DRAFT_432677 [Nemania serpens]|nr:hypothetical protein F5B17DRAFT_432677 [Nemania serpens]